ncbi:NADPH oxidase organizer 1a [Aulostomus maculatus]
MEAERYPISVRLIGVMHKEKKKMYLTSVLWSDNNDITVYRTLGDFKKMHKKMKKEFPAASKLKKSDRIIPKFKVKKVRRSGPRKGPGKSLQRLKSLQKYCNQLLSCDQRVSQSADLIKFFQPKDQDLQPDFSRNGVIIMPPEGDKAADGGGGGGGNVTQPFITETYRCVAPYETKDTKNKPFKVAMDEKVDVLIKDKAGWWLVEKEDKRMAWFPAPYLGKLDEDDDDEEHGNGIPERGMFYTAVKSYKAANVDEITVPIGAVVEVLQKSENGWWLVRYNAKVGYIPTMYLQPSNHNHIRVMAHHHSPGPASPLQLSFLNLPQQNHQLSRSQGNLLQPPSSSPSPSHRLQLEDKQRSLSLNVLSDQLPAQPVASTAASPTSATSSAVTAAPPPVIMVQMDGEEERARNLTDSDESFISDSEFSLSDDLSSSSASSFFNLSQGANSEQLRLSRTPPPMARNRLSPTSALEGKLLPSVSDPNLYKSASTPKVPPRPRAQDILTRCSTITRKNAARGSPSPMPTEITSR